MALILAGKDLIQSRNFNFPTWKKKTLMFCPRCLCWCGQNGIVFHFQIGKLKFHACTRTKIKYWTLLLWYVWALDPVMGHPIFQGCSPKPKGLTPLLHTRLSEPGIWEGSYGGRPCPKFYLDRFTHCVIWTYCSIDFRYSVDPMRSFSGLKWIANLKFSLALQSQTYLVSILY